MLNEHSVREKGEEKTKKIPQICIKSQVFLFLIRFSLSYLVSLK